MEKEYYSVIEIAQMLSISKLTVWNLIQSERLKAVNVGTKKKALYRIHKLELEKFLNKNE